MTTRPPDDACLWLRSNELEVAVLPGKGADIYSVIDRATGIDVLFKTPWGWRDPASSPPTATTQGEWLARYPGGWQILVPHAGPEREVDGVVRGFHGEAAIVPWQVRDETPTSARLTVDLHSAPLRINREIVLNGPVLRLRETIDNLSPDPVEVCWVHHPGFGAPFVDEHCRLDAGAQTFVGETAGPIPDEIRRLEQGRSVFGSLTDFAAPWFALTSPTYGFGIAMAWDPEAFPHAWLWQECHASAGYPWYRRASVFAIEPANVLNRPSDRPPVLGGGARWSAYVTMTRFAAAGPVTNVTGDGTVHM